MNHIPTTLLLMGALAVCFGLDASPGDGFEMAISPAKGSIVEQDFDSVIAVRQDQRITWCITDLPLAQVLRTMSKANLFDIKGTLPVGEAVSVTFLDETLGKALGRLLRGYNYVIMNQETTEKPLLMIIGKAVRTRSLDRRGPFRMFNRQPVRLVPYQNRQQSLPGVSRPGISGGSSTGFGARANRPTNQVQGLHRTAGAGTAGPQGGNVPTPQSKERKPNGTQTAGEPAKQQSGPKGFPSATENTGVKF